MSYYSYKAARDALVNTGDLFLGECEITNLHCIYRPVDSKEYGDEIGNEYYGNLFQICADTLNRQQEEISKLKSKINKLDQRLSIAQWNP